MAGMFRNEPNPISSEGYGREYRQDAISITNAGHDGLLQCHKRSVRRWRNRLGRLPKTGNKPKTKLRGYDGFLLVLMRLTWPMCSADELIAFVLQVLCLPARCNVTSLRRRAARPCLTSTPFVPVAHLGALLCSHDCCLVFAPPCPRPAPPRPATPPS